MKGFWFACMWIFPCVRFCHPCLGQRSGGGTAPSIPSSPSASRPNFLTWVGWALPWEREESGGDILSSRVAEQRARSRNR